MHSCNHIIVRPLTHLSEFAYIHLSFDWAKSSVKLKRALSCILLMHFIWATPPVSYYFHFYEDSSQSFDKLLQSLDMSHRF